MTKIRNFKKGEQVKPAAKFDPHFGPNFLGARAITSKELQEWRDSPHSKGMDEAGETKLPPRQVAVQCPNDHFYLVVKTRAVNRLGWTPRGNHMIVFNTVTGEEFYTHRNLWRKIDE